VSLVIGSAILGDEVSFNVRRAVFGPAHNQLIHSVDRSPLPAILPTVRPDYTKFPARAGISQLAFDAEATLLLVRLETSPDVLHIVTFLPTPSASSPEITHLASAIFTHPVKTAKWSPTGSKRLAVTTRCSAVYFWDCESPWVEERGEDVRGGMMEGVGIPSRTPLRFTG
jgi:hypothetical protein